MVFMLLLLILLAFVLVCLCLVNKVKVESRIENGDARDVICDMAEKLNVDMVVLGSHGYGAIKRYNLFIQK